jgi:hypothetical protein
MASRGDPLSLHLDDRHLSSGHLIGDHNINSSVDHSNNILGLFSRIDQDSRPVGHHLLLRVPGLLGQRRGVGHVGSHTTSATAQVERTRASGSAGPTTVGDMGKAHQIHAVVNNLQEEHQSTVLEMTGTVTDQTLSILIDPSATKSFISGAALKRIKVKEVKQDEFIFVEMASGAKQKVGGKVTGCILNLGEFVIRANLYVTILGSYDVVIGMDWLESHEAILNCKTK